MHEEIKVIINEHLKEKNNLIFLNSLLLILLNSVKY